jgi:chromosomal replication initiation ATPase DnaA
MARQINMHLCHKHSGEKLRDIAERFNVGISAVTEASRLLVKRRGKDKVLREAVGAIKNILKV